MPLTNAQILEAQPRARGWKLNDGGGLYLFITPKGSRLWRMKYSAGGGEQTLSFGSWPVVTIHQARALRDEAQLELFRGGDPARRRREAKIAAAILATS